MKKTFTALTAAAVVAALAVPIAANADVFIGLQEAGVNGGALTQVASDPSFANFVGGYGSFTINSITASQLTAPLDSTALDVSGSTSGELKIYVSSTDNSPTGAANFLSGLTINLLPAGWTATLSTYLDAGNTPFTLTTLLGTHVFNNLDAVTESAAANPSLPYSVTGIYDIVATGVGTSLGTIHVSTIPEPSSLAILLLGLVGMAAFGIGKKGLV